MFLSNIFYYDQIQLTQLDILRRYHLFFDKCFTYVIFCNLRISTGALLVRLKYTIYGLLFWFCKRWLSVRRKIKRLQIEIYKIFQSFKKVSTIWSFFYPANIYVISNELWDKCSKRRSRQKEEECQVYMLME